MAARRMGFSTVFEALGSIEEFRTGLLDGTLPATRFFTANILPLVIAEQKQDKFAAAKVVRDLSPLLNAQTIKNAPDQRGQLRVARYVESLMRLWNTDEPSCGAIVGNVAESGLFSIPESLKAIVMRETLPETEKANAEAENDDPVPEEHAGARELSCSAILRNRSLCAVRLQRSRIRDPSRRQGTGVRSRNGVDG